MGERRSRLRHRLRTLSRRRGPGCHRQGARRVFHACMIMPAIDRQEAFSGTKEVAAPLALDVARLKSFLASRLPDCSAALSVRQFKGGQSNPTYLLETPGRRYVLRRKPPGKLLPSAHAVDREFRVISALHRQDFPVPEPVAYCDDPNVVGTAFFVMGFVEGRIFWEPHLPHSH